MDELFSFFARHCSIYDISQINEKAEELGHFPLFLAIDRYFWNIESSVRDYVHKSSFIYYTEGREDMWGCEFTNDDKKAYNKLKYFFGRLETHLKIHHQNLFDRYRTYTYLEINSLEMTNFSQSFILWVQWKYCKGTYLGHNRLDVYPSWCYSHHSPELCFLHEDKQIRAIKNCYDVIIEKLARKRLRMTRIDISELLLYNNDRERLILVHDKDNGLPVIKDNPDCVDKIQYNQEVRKELHRLAKSIGHGLYFVGKKLTIPKGDPVYILPKTKFGVEREIQQEEYKEYFKPINNTPVDGSPFTIRFINWLKEQEWYTLWAAIYYYTFKEEAEIHLHSRILARSINSYTPEGGLSQALSLDEFPQEFYGLTKQIKEEAERFLAQDRGIFVEQISNRLSENPHGYLLTSIDEVFDLFGISGNYTDKTSGEIILSSLRSQGMSFAPFSYRTQICIYNQPSVWLNPSQWEEKYVALFSLAKIAAKISKETSLIDDDLQALNNFLAKHKKANYTHSYLLGCFLVWANEGPWSGKCDFSKLKNEEKVEYYDFLMSYTRGDEKRVKVLEKYLNKLDGCKSLKSEMI